MADHTNPPVDLTVQELEALIQAKKEAERQAAQKKAQEEAEAKAKQAKEVEQAKIAALAAPIIKALQLAAPERKFFLSQYGRIEMLDDKGDADWDFPHIDIVRGYRRTAPLRVVVGDYGNRVNYPVKADGTVSADKIVAKVMETYQYKVAARKTDELRNKVREANAAAEAQVKETLGLPGYSGYVTANSVEGQPPVIVKASFTRAMTPEEAIEVYQYLRARKLI